MKLPVVRFFAVAVACSLLGAVCLGEEKRATDAEVIKYGVSEGTLILAGKFAGTFSGGHGANSTITVEQVFKKPEGFGAPKQIQVFWTTLKEEKPQTPFSTNTYLFFLRPDEGGFRDVTKHEHRFVLATGTNVHLLKRLTSR